MLRASSTTSESAVETSEWMNDDMLDNDDSLLWIIKNDESESNSH